MNYRSVVAKDSQIYVLLASCFTLNTLRVDKESSTPYNLMTYTAVLHGKTLSILLGVI